MKIVALLPGSATLISERIVASPARAQFGYIVDQDGYVNVREKPVISMSATIKMGRTFIESSNSDGAGSYEAGF